MRQFDMRLCAAAGIGICLSVIQSAVAQPNVRITGGPDQSGHNYSWTIVNDHVSPIVRVEIPHYKSDLFTPPEGWTGTIEKSGICVAVADRPSIGVGTGRSAVFAMRIAPYAGQSGIRSAKGDVRIHFADGSQAVVPAQVPVGESWLDRYVSLIGVGVIPAIALLWQAIRRRKPRNATTQP